MCTPVLSQGKRQPTPVFLPGESHGRRSLVGYSPRGRKESDTTERLHSLSIAEIRVTECKKERENSRKSIALKLSDGYSVHYAVLLTWYLKFSKEIVL